jgi:hypothetical protein
MVIIIIIIIIIIIAPNSDVAVNNKINLDRIMLIQ